jgi:hypothetical protein
MECGGMYVVMPGRYLWGVKIPVLLVVEMITVRHCVGMGMECPLENLVKKCSCGC